MSPAPLVIDVVSDVVCPWCYVGKRRLEAALRARPDLEVRVRYHPFQLDPTIPPGGIDRRTYMERKFGSAARIEEIHERLREAGRAEGIPFAFDKIIRAVNTLDAHRVLLWAELAGVQAEAKEALMRAYFIEGRDIGDGGVLADIAGDVGMDRQDVAARLTGDGGKAEVQAAVEQAVRLGVTGVPFFIFAQAFAVSGAQPAELLATALDQAREHQLNPQPAVASA